MKAMLLRNGNPCLIWLAALALMVALPIPALAQPTEALVENWRDTDFGFNSSMLDTDVNGDAYVLGSNPATNILIIKKISAAGMPQWEQVYDDPVYNLRGVWIATDPAGSAVVVANIVQSTDGSPQGWLTLKYDGLGNLLWARPLPRAFSSVARVVIDPFGSIYVAGTGVLTKYSPAGATLWQDDTGVVGHPHSIAVSLLGDRIAIAGTSNPRSVDFRAVMFDANGNHLWTNTTAAPYAASDVAFYPNFDNTTYFGTGTYFPLDPNPYQMAIVRFDVAGNPLWTKSYSVGDRVARLVVSSQLGGVVATGLDANGYLDWMTIKTDFDGNLQWSQRYDGTKTNDESPNMLAVGLDGGIYVTGKGGPTPDSGNLSYLKGVVVKYAADGTRQWAVWDDYAGGMAIRTSKVDPMGAPLDFTTLGWGYLTTAHYAQTGQPDLLPSAPGNLSGFVTSSTSVALTFTDNASNEFWVEAERCTGSGCTNFIKVAQTVGENATGLSDSTVTQGMTYTYRVKARGFMGLSEPSNTLSITTPGVALAAPTGLQAQARRVKSRAQVLLSWIDNASNETGYSLERCTGSTCTNFSPIASLVANAAGYTDTGVARATTYRYRVRATGNGVTSAYSNIASVKTP
jgi:hypothetical protein